MWGVLFGWFFLFARCLERGERTAISASSCSQRMAAKSYRNTSEKQELAHYQRKEADRRITLTRLTIKSTLK